MSQIIMSWSKCTVEIGDTGASDAMATTLADVGKIKDKSSVLEPTVGEVLSSVASGGELIAREELEGGLSFTTRVTEPSHTLLAALGLGEVVDTTDFGVDTHVVDSYKSLKVTPKNVGATGIKAAKTQVSARPGYNETDGHFLDLIFTIVKPSTGKWYTRFVKPAPTQG